LKVYAIEQRESELDVLFSKRKYQNFLTELLIAKPYDVEYGTVENMKKIRYKVTNAKKSPEISITESVYNKLRDILKKSGTGNVAKGLEKSFDYLTFEISRLKENFNENLESRFAQLNSETENISRKIDRKTDGLDLKLNNFKDQMETRTSNITQEIANIKGTSSSSSSPDELRGLAKDIETMKGDLMNLQKVIEYFKGMFCR
jgi:chaperonin cofactor prefoldin